MSGHEQLLHERKWRAVRAAHEANRAYCEGLEDTSQVPFDEAPDWQRLSAVAGVQAVIDNPNITPEQSHEGWLALKLADGWEYGPAKDPDKKRHPCCVPYADLPVSQRYKDTISGAVVRGVLGMV